MFKMFNIDWDFKRMVKLEGKCTGNGCPARLACYRYTTSDYDEDAGFIAPPRVRVKDHEMSGHMPKKCFLFISNAKFKPAIHPFTIED
jgi:hypothetical protein